MHLKSVIPLRSFFFIAPIALLGISVAQTEEENRQLKEVLTHPMGLAIWKAEVETMKAWLDDGGDPNFVLAGKPLLHWAVRIAKRPEQHPMRPKPDFSSPPAGYDYDPFEESLENDEKRSKQIVALLLSRGAKPDALDDEKQTVLHLAFKKKKAYLVPPLLKAGADPNLKGVEGIRPLVRAAMAGDMATCRQLVEAGADPDAIGIDDFTVLEWILVSGHTEVELAELIKLGADPGKTGDSGWTPLSLAAAQAEPASFRLLVEHGADPTFENDSGETLIYQAVNRLHEKDPETIRKFREVIELLIKLSIDIDEPTDSGQTPLHAAALENAPVSARILIALGATVDLPDEEGITPLHLALRDNRREVVDVLLEHGADVDAVSKSLGSGVTIAARRFHEGRVNRDNYLELLELTLKQAEETEAADAGGRTALHWGAASNDPEAVDALVKKGAVLDATDKFGRTPLMWAACANADLGIGRLLKHKADPNTKDRRGKTALDWAKELDQETAVKSLEKATAP